MKGCTGSTVRTVGPDIIQNTMTMNQLEKIRPNLHFNDNETTAARNDRLHKLRAGIDKLLKNFWKVPLEETL